MAFRSKDTVKKIVKKLGGEKNLMPGTKESLGRAHRGLYAARHIYSGNRVSEKGGNMSGRSWKPNVQEKQLFSYIMDRRFCGKVTTHALGCTEEAGGIDEDLLKTPDKKMDTETGLLGEAKIEKMDEEPGKKEEVVSFAPEEESKDEEVFDDGLGPPSTPEEIDRAAERILAWFIGEDNPLEDGEEDKAVEDGKEDNEEDKALEEDGEEDVEVKKI